MPVIRISDSTYQKLEKLAHGFDTPDAVINKLIDGVFAIPSQELPSIRLSKPIIDFDVTHSEVKKVTINDELLDIKGWNLLNKFLYKTYKNQSITGYTNALAARNSIFDMVKEHNLAIEILISWKDKGDHPYKNAMVKWNPQVAEVHYEFID
jgi:hypothetical protein